MHLFFIPLLTGFALTACHLVGTVSSWVLPHSPTTSTLVRTSRPSAPPLHMSPRHHWDSCGCCRNAASQQLLIPSTSRTTATQQILQAPKTAAKVDSCLQTQKNLWHRHRTCSVWTWWKNFRVWGCIEWLRGECLATVKQRDRSSHTSADGVRVHWRQFTAETASAKKNKREKPPKLLESYLKLSVVHRVRVWICVWQKHHFILSFLILSSHLSLSLYT